MRTLKIVVNDHDVNVFLDSSHKKGIKALSEHLLITYLNIKLKDNLEAWVKEFDKRLDESLEESTANTEQDNATVAEANKEAEPEKKKAKKVKEEAVAE